MNSEESLEKDFEEEYEKFKELNKDKIKKFEDNIEKAQKEIEACMKEASKAIDKAVNISEKYGVPFCGISDLYQTYTPESLETKLETFKKSLICPSESEDALEELMEQLIEEHEMCPGEYPGWLHSAIC